MHARQGVAAKTIFSPVILTAPHELVVHRKDSLHRGKALQALGEK
jgi:hypothetical protein